MQFKQHLEKQFNINMINAHDNLAKKSFSLLNDRFFIVVEVINFKNVAPLFYQQLNVLYQTLS